MMSGVNEVSDDEDKPSLFHWRHQTRVEPTESEKAEKAKFEEGKFENLDKLQHTKDRLERLEKDGGDKLTSWNVETLCKDGSQRTVINKYQITEDENLERLKKFVEKYEEEIKKFGMYKRLEDSQQFLIDHPHLTCEYTANYLVNWSIDLEEEGKSSLMNQVVHQAFTMQILLEMAEILKEDPRACIRPFFTEIVKDEQAAFDDDLESFKGRIRERTEARRQWVRDELAKQQYIEEEESSKWSNKWRTFIGSLFGSKPKSTRVSARKSNRGSKEQKAKLSDLNSELQKNQQDLGGSQDHSAELKRHLNVETRQKLVKSDKVVQLEEINGEERAWLRLQEELATQAVLLLGQKAVKAGRPPTYPRSTELVMLKQRL